MKKIAVIGANGQVGAELCLLLARLPEVELVPICRTVSGSAFLRRHGIAVRHGAVADVADARRLLGDCTVIINAALASGTPGELRRSEDAIIGNALRESPRDAQLIHCSTQSVYGDPRPGRWLRTRNPYGRAKLGTERTALSVARATRKSLHILRLGHVCGPLQGISADLRRALQSGAVPVPSRDLPSNTVYTVVLVDAVLAIAAGRVAPGVYDLMNAPQLTWREVLETEAALAGVAFTPRVRPGEAPSPLARLRSRLSGLARIATSDPARALAAALLAHAPARINARAQAHWHLARAGRDIAAVNTTAPAAEHFYWRANGSRWIDALTPTLELLARAPYQGLLEPGRAAWPPDLPDAVVPEALGVQALRSTAM